MMKNQKGITLIALVITIIVLLILAGVAISTITGDTSVMNKAQQASWATKNAEELSNVQLAVVNAMAENSDNLGALDKDILQAQLRKTTGKSDLTLVDEADGWSLTGNMGTYTIGSKGAVEQTSVFNGTLVPTTSAPTATTQPTPIYETIASKKTEGTILSQTDVIVLQDDNGRLVKIPAKFKIASDSATVVADGIVIEDANGNQFVWIPVDNIANYIRTWFTGDGSLSNYSESMPSNEQTSVANNKGYYIGRYEAGDSATGYTENSTKNSLRGEGTSQTNPVSIKKGCAPYNYITKANAITRATAMKTEQSYTATTRLCSSYAWDTAINFIQSKGGDLATYGSNSPQGNYYDKTFTYKNISGSSATKANNNSTLIPTGQTIAVCNIYDMGGNLEEWTTEDYYSPSYPYSIRGGNYQINYAPYASGYRGKFGEQCSTIGFRITLFL